MILLMFSFETVILALPLFLELYWLLATLKKIQYLLSSNKVEGNALIHLYSSLIEMCFNHVVTYT